MPVTQEQREQFKEALNSLSSKQKDMFEYIISNPEKINSLPNNDTHFNLTAASLIPFANKQGNEISDLFIENFLETYKNRPLNEALASFIEGVNINKNRQIHKNAPSIHSETQGDFLSPESVKKNQEMDNLYASITAQSISGISHWQTVPVQNIPEPKNVKVPNQSKESATQVSKPETKLGEFQSKLSEFMKDKDLAKMIDISSDPIKKLSEIYDSNKGHKPNFLKAIKDGREIESLCKKAGLGSSGELHKDVRDFIKAICLGKEPSQSMSQGRS